MARESILVVCSHNSARSQMAEGWLRHVAPSGRFEIHSAGVEPGTLNPFAVRAMAEIGIDISGHRAQGIEEFLGYIPVHHLIIVCDKAAQSCPRVWPGVRERHFWPFDDPSAVEGSDEQKLDAFRRVRDAIREKIDSWLSETGSPTTTTRV